MRVVFMGTPVFALPALDSLAADHQVLAVYTRADAASGRGKTLLPTPIKERALELDIPVYTPSIFDEGEVDRLAGMEPDLLVVVAYGMLLPQEVLDIPRFGALNIHASLLPRWRGAAPLQRAILAGDEVAGVSIMRVEEGLDSGAFCAQSSVPLAGKDLPELEGELSQMGAELLLKAMEELETGQVCWQEQDGDKACYASKIDKRELRLDPALDAGENLRKVRASSDQAPAKASVCGRGVTLLKAVQMADGSLSDLPVGTVVWHEKHLLLGCSEGALEVLRLKPDGGKVMEASAFAAGLNKVLGTDDAVWQALS